MRNFKIIRTPSIFDGTFGMMLDDIIPFCLTLERIWINNEKEKSCIPEGNYICRRVNSKKFGNTFEICDVPNRSSILFHQGNLMDDSHGCVILGEQFELLNGKNAVLASGKGFGEFLERTQGINEFQLTIKWTD